MQNLPIRTSSADAGTPCMSQLQDLPRSTRPAPSCRFCMPEVGRVSPRAGDTRTGNSRTGNTRTAWPVRLHGIDVEAKKAELGVPG